MSATQNGSSPTTTATAAAPATPAGSDGVVKPTTPVQDEAAVTAVVAAATTATAAVVKPVAAAAVAVAVAKPSSSSEPAVVPPSSAPVIASEESPTAVAGLTPTAAAVATGQATSPSAGPSATPGSKRPPGFLVESGEKSDTGEDGVPRGRDSPDDSKTNLIINYLPPNMSEGTLATLFSPYGVMENCKIVVDLQTGKSKGYGFVKYKTSSSAAHAKEALNGYAISGKTLKVAFARPHCKEITNANLFVTQLPKTYTKEDLRNLFKQFGRLIECKVLYDENNRSRGVGFVRMDTHKHAIAARDQLDGYQPKDAEKPLKIKLATKSTPRSSRSSPSRSPRRFSFPMGPGTPHNHLPHGSHPMVPMSPQAYEHYYTPRSPMGQHPHAMGSTMSPRYMPAQSPYHTPHYHMPMVPASPYGIMGERNSPAHPYQQYYYPRTPQQMASSSTPTSGPPSSRPGTPFCLFVYNIPPDYDEEQLRGLFEDYGKMESVRIIRNLRTHKSKGYGFVNFTRLESAQQAIEHLDGYKIKAGKPLQVRFKSERPSEGGQFFP